MMKGLDTNDDKGNNAKQLNYLINHNITPSTAMHVRLAQIEKEKQSR